MSLTAPHKLGIGKSIDDCFRTREAHDLESRKKYAPETDSSTQSKDYDNSVYETWITDYISKFKVNSTSLAYFAEDLQVIYLALSYRNIQDVKASAQHKYVALRFS